MDFDLADSDNFSLYVDSLVNHRLDLLEELFDKFIVLNLEK